MRTLLILIIGLVASERALACGKPELRAFVEQAQALSARAEQDGSKLLGCSGETAEAAQWLAFHKALAPPPAKPSPLPKAAAARSDVAGEVGRAIVSAYGGAVAGLKSKIDTGDPRYSQAPDAHLAVGRMLVRNRQFAEGRRYYENFLRLREGSPAEELEYLYSYIWEGDLDRADRELRAANVSGAPADFAKAIERGRALVAKLRAARPAGSSSSPSAGKCGATRAARTTMASSTRAGNTTCSRPKSTMSRASTPTSSRWASARQSATPSPSPATWATSRTRKDTTSAT